MNLYNLYKEQDILLLKECYALEKIHGCLKKGTKIKLSNGKEKNIEDIKKNDEVISLDEKTHKFTKMKVKNIIIQEADMRLGWIEIVLENNRILTCTEDHPCLTQRGWIEAKELTLTDDLINYADNSVSHRKII